MMKSGCPACQIQQIIDHFVTSFSDSSMYNPVCSSSILSRFVFPILRLIRDKFCNWWDINRRFFPPFRFFRADFLFRSFFPWPACHYRKRSDSHQNHIIWSFTEHHLSIYCCLCVGPDQLHRSSLVIPAPRFFPYFFSCQKRRFLL